jgi:hypothetical protein
MDECGCTIDKNRQVVKSYFEKYIKPHVTIENKDNTQIFFDIYKKVSPIPYSVCFFRWYESSLRMSCFVRGNNIQYFLFSTVPGENDYCFESHNIKV